MAESFSNQELKAVALPKLYSWVCHILHAASKFCPEVLLAKQFLNDEIFESSILFIEAAWLCIYILNNQYC